MPLVKMDAKKSAGGGASYELRQNVAWAGNSNFSISVPKKPKGIQVYGTGSTNKKVLFSNYYNGDFNDSSIHRYDTNADMTLVMTSSTVEIQTQWESSTTYFDVIILYE